MHKDSYQYASARVRALEPKLLNMTEVERMLGASDAREAYKILNDLDYANHIGDIENVQDFQEVITAGLHDSKQILDKISPDSRILDILFLRYDFHNIKTILKGQKSDKGQEEIRVNLLPLGRVPIDAMLTFFFDKEKASLPLPEEYTAIIKGWIEMAKAQEDPRMIDLILDQASFAIILDIAKLLNNAFVENFVKQWIDLHNIRTFVRVKLLKQESFFMEGNAMDLLFIRGGSLAIHKFTENMDVDPSGISNVFRGTDYAELVEKGLEAFNKFKSFVYLEKFADEYLMRSAKKARYIPSGPESLIAYFFAKQNNAKIIRMIMVGKLNGLSETVMREHLNELYV